MNIKFSTFKHLDAPVRTVAFCPSSQVVALLLAAPPRLVACQYVSDVARQVFEINEPFETSKLDSGGFLGWSWDGSRLYTIGSRSITVFSLSHHLNNPALKKSDYFEDKSEILAFAISRDEGEIFYGTLEGKVAKLKKGEIVAQHKYDNKIVAIIADSLKLFVGVLTLQNVFTVSDFATLKPERSIDLSLRAGEMGPRSHLILCENRKIDQSPDLNYVLIPTLEDKKLPLAMGLERKNEFKVSAIYGGSFAPITVLKFIPCVFQRDKEEFCVFAMGDAHGNISLWVYREEKPTCLLKSDDFSLTIENIDFSHDCELMIAVTNRKFFITVQLTDSLFGGAKKILRRDYLKVRFGESDLREFKQILYTDLRAQEEKVETREVPSVVKKIVVRKKTDRPNEEPEEAKQVASNPISLPPTSAAPTIFFAKPPALEEDQIIPFASGYLSISPKEKRGVIKKFAEGKLEWRASGFDQIVDVCLNSKTLAVTNLSGFLFFLSLVTGNRIKERLLIDNIYRVKLGRMNSCLVVKCDASFVLFDIESQAVRAKGSFSTVLNHEYSSLNIKEKKENAFDENSVDFHISYNDEVVLRVFDKLYSFNCSIGGWRIFSGLDIEQEAPPLEHLTDNEEIMETAFKFFENSKREVIGDIEEAIITACRTSNKAAFSECLKEYVINLAKTGEFDKLKSFLTFRIMCDQDSEEHRFLKRVGVSPKVVCKNAIGLIRHVDNSQELVSFLTELINNSE